MEKPLAFQQIFFQLKSKLVPKNYWNYFYLLISIIMLTLSVHVAINMAWNGDFWEHAAVIRSFQQNVFSPSHPILDLQAPHHLFTPFHLTLALFGNVLELDAPTILSVWAPINLVVFLIGVFRFTECFCISSASAKIRFFLLLFILFGWSGNVWFFSGFLSVRAFAFIAPYPSTLTIGLMLLAVSNLYDWFKSSKHKDIAIFFFSYLFVALVHHITFLSMSVICLCICVPHIFKQKVKTFIAITIALIVLIAMLTWPYYDLLQLLQDNDEFIKGNSAMYVSPYVAIYPALLFLPALFWFQKLHISPVIICSLIILALLYIIGLLGFQPMMGRVINIIAFLGHMISATTIVFIISSERVSKIKKNKFLNLIFIGAFAYLLLPLMSLDEIKRFNQTLLNGKLDFESAKMVEPYLDENSIIFGPIGLGWEIVSLKGKLVASKTGLAFVESHIERQATARKICKLDTPETEFLSFLKFYKVTNLMLPANCSRTLDMLSKPDSDFRLTLLTPRYQFYQKIGVGINN